MRLRLIALTAVTCLGAATLVTQAQAAPVTGLTTPLATNQSLAEPVAYRTYCSRWREECRERWGFRTWRYRRCLSFHGCY
jgi:predicted transglutaminase-like cysteine proteinase